MDGWWPNGLMSVGSLSLLLLCLPSLPLPPNVSHWGEEAETVSQWVEKSRAHWGEKHTAHCTGEKSRVEKTFLRPNCHFCHDGDSDTDPANPEWIGPLGKINPPGWQGTGGQEEGFIISLKVLDCVETNTFGKLTKYICQFWRIYLQYQFTI